MAPRPALRIAVVATFLLITSILPLAIWPWHAGAAAVLMVLSLRTRVRWRPLAKRFLILWFFAALMAAGLWGRPDAPMRTGTLFVKTTLSLWALVILTSSLSIPELLAGLKQLRFPPLWLNLLSFLARYMTVLSDEWNRMHLARRARSFHLTRWQQLRLLSHALGLLFIRGYDRAERIHRAMLARGWTTRD